MLFLCIALTFAQFSAAQTSKERISGKALKDAWSSEINSLMEVVKDQEKQLTDLQTDNLESYSKIAKNWRTLVDLNFDKINELELKITEKVEKCKDNSCEKDILELDEFITSAKNDREKLREYYYQTRWKIAQKRADLYQEIIKKKSRLDIWTDKFDEDFIREGYSILDRALGFLYTKIKLFQSSLQKGPKGIVSVIRDFFYLFMVFIVPWLIYRSIGAFLPKIEIFKDHLYTKRPYGFTNSVRLANYISFVAPFLPWIAAIATLRMCTWLVTGTVFDELNALVPILMFYFYFRIAEICLEKVGYLLIHKSIQRNSASDYTKLVKSTVSTLGWFILISIGFLYLTELAVGKSIIFDLTFHLTIFIGVIVGLLTISKWNPILTPFLEKRPDNLLFSYLARNCKGRGRIIFSIPALIIIMSSILIERVSSEVSEWEITKTVSAQIFSKQLKDHTEEESEKQPLPEGYIEQLTQDPGSTKNQILMKGNEKVLQTALSEIKEWENGQSEEQSLVISGESGSGKSTVLSRISSHFIDRITVTYIKIEKRLDSREEVFSLFEKYIPELGLDGLTALYKFDSQGEKRLFLIDDAHFLFLTKLQGFEGYKALVDIVNARTKNLFWCTTFNREAWNFLNGVFGRRSYFRNHLSIEKWTDAEIREMLQKRHSGSETKISFASLTRGRIETTQAEMLFYRLLWEQSGGNPQVAIQLWLESVYPIRGNVLGVTAPSRPQERELSRLSDICHFIFMAICRHEHLTRVQIATVLQISELEVANALKIGLENKILVRVDQGYRVSNFWQKPLISFLKARNFLYG